MIGDQKMGASTSPQPMESGEVVLGSEIFNYRERMRLTPNPVALAFGMTTDELLKVEADNQPLSPELAQKWRIFTSVARRSRGHIRHAAPKRHLSFDRPKCEQCGLPLWRPKRRYSKRAGQWLWQLFCGTKGCSGQNRIISFSATGERVVVPSFFTLPHERPKCVECGRHFVVHSTENHSELGLIRRMYCDNSGCKMQYAVHWFNDQGKEVRRPHNREQKLLTFPRPPCAFCGGETISLGRRHTKRRGDYFMFRCRDCSLCSWSSDGVAHKCKKINASGLRKVGRPRGRQGKDTSRQIVLAAALCLQGYSHPKMLPYLYPGQHDKEAGRKAVQKFLKRHASAINHQTTTMTSEHAKQLLNA